MADTAIVLRSTSGGTKIADGTGLVVTLYDRHSGGIRRKFQVDGGGPLNQKGDPYVLETGLHALFNTHTHVDHCGEDATILAANAETEPVLVISPEAYACLPRVLTDAERFKRQKGTNRQLEKGIIKQIASRSYPVHLMLPGESFSLDGISVTAFAQPEGLEHLPGTLHYRFAMPDEIDVSTIFDAYAEVSGDQRKDAQHFSQFQRLGKNDGRRLILVTEQTLAYRKENPGTQEEREREFVQAVARQVKRVSKQNGKGCVAGPAFAQFRFGKTLELFLEGINASGVPYDSVTKILQGPMALDLMKAPGSPYAWAERVAREYINDPAWRFDFPDGRMYVLVATPGFGQGSFSGDAVDSILTGNIKYGVGGGVVLGSKYAPHGSLFREMLDKKTYKGARIPEGTLELCSITGHINFAGAYKRMLEETRADFLYPVHGSPKAVAEYCAMAGDMGFVRGKNLFVPTPGLSLLVYREGAEVVAREIETCSEAAEIAGLRC